MNTPRTTPRFVLPDSARRSGPGPGEFADQVKQIISEALTPAPVAPADGHDEPRPGAATPDPLAEDPVANPTPPAPPTERSGFARLLVEVGEIRASCQRSAELAGETSQTLHDIADRTASDLAKIIAMLGSGVPQLRAGGSDGPSGGTGEPDAGDTGRPPKPESSAARSIRAPHRSTESGPTDPVPENATGPDEGDARPRRARRQS